MLSINFIIFSLKGLYKMPIFPMTVSMVDAYGRSVSKRFDLDETDYAAALSLAGDFIDDLAALTEARILSYTLATKVVYNDVVTAGANRDEGITFSVRTEDNEKAVIKVPAPINSVINSDGTVDLLDSAVAAFAANYLNGQVLVDDGEVVTEFISGRLDT